MIALLPRPVSIAAIEGLLLQALRSASWFVAGLCALSAARDLVRRDLEEGVTALVAQRGHDPKSLELSRGLAAALLIATWIGLPAVLLALLAWVRVSDLSSLPWAIAWVSFAIVYSIALGLVIGALARVASHISPERGRLVLIGLVLTPELLRAVWPSVPSVPAAFAWALDRAAELNAMTAWTRG